MWGGNINSEDGKQGESLKDFLKIFIAADGPLNESDPMQMRLEII